MRLSILLTLAAALAGDVPEELLQDVRGPDERKRRSAVTKLADLGIPEAWELVVERLSDEEPEVADRAQIELARAEGEDALEIVHGRSALRSKEPLVRERVVESFGRATRTVAPEELIKPLGDKEADVRRMAAWSVERLVRSGQLGEEDRDKLADAVDRVAKGDRDDAVRGAGLIALATLGDERAAGRVEDGLRAREVAVQSGALIALGVLGSADGPARTLEFLEELRGDGPEATTLRRAAVRGLEAQGDRAALLALADVLEAAMEQGASTLRLQQIVVAALRGMTGEGIGRNARAWRGWAEALPPDWSAQPVARDLEVGDTVAQLAGLPILSDSLSVLIDMSGSMWRAGEDGRTLKQLVEIELRRFFEVLPDAAHFNLITYATEPLAWERELVEARPKSEDAALEWFRESRLRGRGNVWDAIDLALEDEAVDTLIILTDGAPTGGPHWDMRLIPELLLERNRFRQVAFDVILTDPNASLEKRWQELSRRSGGICTTVRFAE